MGNTTSRSETGAIDPSGLSLDELGGWDRPAIKRGDSLNKKLEWLHRAVRKQANLMEHELLKMPDLDTPSSSVAKEDLSGKPHWDSTFWNLLSQKRALENEAIVSTTPTGNSNEDEKGRAHKEERRRERAKRTYDRPWEQNSKTRPRSWKRTLRTRVQNRLQELKQEEREERRNNDIPSTEDRQWPVWRTNVARAKIKILLYLKKVMMDVRGEKEHSVTIRERSLPAYLMVRLGCSFPKFCQHQLHCLQSSNLDMLPGAAEEMDATLSLSSAELNNVEALGDQSRDSSEGVTEERDSERSVLLMQVLANRANAKWVEAVDWVRPYVYDPATLIMGRADIRIYKQLLIDYLQEGKIALKLIDSNVQAEVLDESGDIRVESVLHLDFWEQVKTFFPWKISSGKRIEGLPLLARRLFQTVIDLESLAGSTAVQKLKLVLCIDEEQESFVQTLLVQFQFFGLNRENVLLIKLPRFRGMHPNTEGTEMQLSNSCPRSSAGSGWAILALKWPMSAYTLDIETNQPHYLQGSALQWLRDRGVDWINTQFFMDWERFVPSTTFDIDFCSTALYCSDERSSNLAMEVMDCASSREAGRTANIVLGKANNDRHCCSIHTSDLLTSQTRALIFEQEEMDALVSCQHRYMIKTRALEEITLAPCGLRSNIEVHNGAAYLNFDLSKLTSVPGIRCAAVSTTSAGPPVDVVLSSKWFHNIAARLLVQDRQAEFATAAAQYSKANGSISIDPLEPCERRRKFAVSGNLVCRRTVALASAFAGNDADELHIVTSVVGEQHIPKATDFLESFQAESLLRDCVVRHHVLTRGSGRVTQVMEKYLQEVNASLLVVGSENLARESSETVGSFCMSVAKSFYEVPLLIVKVNSAGDAHRPRVDTSDSANGSLLRGIKCLVEIRPTATPLLEWLLPRLRSEADKVFLAKSRAIDHTDTPTPAASRMLSAFVDKASHLGFPTTPRPLKGEPVQSLDKAVCEDQIDVLALQINASRSLPAHAVQILKTVKSSILIYRGPTPPLQQG